MGRGVSSPGTPAPDSRTARRRTGLSSSSLYITEMSTFNLVDEDRRRVPTPALDTGRIIIARNAREVEEVISRWRAVDGDKTVAHDLECAASATVKNGSGLHPHLGTIRLGQWAVRDGGDGVPEALVINYWNTEPQAALDLLSDPEWKVLIHYTQMELPWHGYTRGLRLTNVVDTHLTGKLNYKRLEEQGLWVPHLDEDIQRQEEGKDPRFALGITSQRVAGFDMDKTQQTSHWDARSLSNAQEIYAGVDVLALLDLEPHLTEHLTEEDWEVHNQRIEALTTRSLDYVQGQVAKGCESPRIRRMIDACQSMAELERLRAALPQTRLHYSARPDIEQAIARTHERLRQGRGPKKPLKVTAPSNSQPF